MPKRKRTILADMVSVFERIFAAVSQIPEGPNKQQLAHYLKKFKSEILSEAAAKEKERTKAAEDYTLDEAVEVFNLTYSTSISQVNDHSWKIDDLQETKDFITTPCIESLLGNYSEHFDRTSKAACKMAIGFILNECLTVMKGDSQPSEDSRPQTSKRWDAIKIHCEVSFYHKINPPPTALFSACIVNGCVDHGIGVALNSKKTLTDNQHYHSLLVVVEAKFQRGVELALPQLVVYLACLRQSRLQRLRSDASVYGLASDGYIFIFVTISHEGVLKLSKQFDLLHGHLKVVLGCLKYVLEKTASMTPTLMLERGSQQISVHETAVGDEQFLFGDQDYLHPPKDGTGDDEGSTSDASTSD